MSAAAAMSSGAGQVNRLLASAAVTDGRILHRYGYLWSAVGTKPMQGG